MKEHQICEIPQGSLAEHQKEILSRHLCELFLPVSFWETEAGMTMVVETSGWVPLQAAASLSVSEAIALLGAFLKGWEDAEDRYLMPETLSWGPGTFYVPLLRREKAASWGGMRLAAVFDAARAEGCQGGAETAAHCTHLEAPQGCGRQEAVQGGNRLEAPQGCGRQEAVQRLGQVLRAKIPEKERGYLQRALSLLAENRYGITHSLRSLERLQKEVERQKGVDSDVAAFFRPAAEDLPPKGRGTIHPKKLSGDLPPKGHCPKGEPTV